MSQSKDRASRASMLRTHDTDYEADISSDDNLSMLPSTPANIDESSAPQVDVRRRVPKSIQSPKPITADSKISPEVAENGNNSSEDVPKSTEGDLEGTPVAVCSSDGSSTLVSPHMPQVPLGILLRSSSAGSSSPPYPSSSSPCIRLPDHTHMLQNTPQVLRMPFAVAEGLNTRAQLSIRSETASYHDSPISELSSFSVSSSPPRSSPAAYVLRGSLPSRLNELHLHSEDFSEVDPSYGPRTGTTTTGSKSTTETFRVVKTVGEADEVLRLTPDLNIKLKAKDATVSGSPATNDPWLPVLPFKRAPQGMEHEFDELVARLKTMMKERKEDEFEERVVATLRSLASGG